MSDFIESGKKDIIDIINKTGYMLEEKSYKILKEFGVVRNVVFYKEDGRVEIDLIHNQGKIFFLIECKKTSYDWFFAPALLKEKIELTKIINGKFSIVKYSSLYKIAKHQIAIKINEKGIIERNNKKDTSRSTENFNKAIFQLLHNIDVYTEKSDLRDHSYIIPIIVTNANLWYLEYKENQIDNNGNLLDCTTFPEKVLVYNFPFVAKWQERDYSVDRSFGQPSSTKSIFVVNINYLKEFIINFISSMEGA